MRRVRICWLRISAAVSVLLGFKPMPELCPVEMVITADTTQLEESLARARSSIESVQASREALGRPQLLIKPHKRLSSEQIDRALDSLDRYRRDPDLSFIIPSDVEATVYQLVADHWEPL